jgi:hypothetical protein
LAENKTRATASSVEAFLDRIPNASRRQDAYTVLRMLKGITRQPPKMWGPSIVGFGSYHYLYESGREGDAPLLGFSPRKPELVIYLSCGLADETLKKKLGKYKAGKSCLYVKKLDDIDRAVLRKLAVMSVASLRKRYP